MKHTIYTKYLTSFHLTFLKKNLFGQSFPGGPVEFKGKSANLGTYI